MRSQSIVLTSLVLALSGQAFGQQCGAWLPVTQPTPALAAPVTDLVNFDPDGAGPLSEVVVISGGVSNLQLAAWNGTSITNFANPFSGNVTDLIVFNGELVAAGRFITANVGSTPITANRIARWNGTASTAFGTGITATGSSVNALAVYNGELYAGGTFTVAATGVTVNRVARWDGSAWQPLAGPGQTPGVDGNVDALVVHNGELIAGGAFTNAGGVPARAVARWNGTSWQAFTPVAATFGTVSSLSVFNGQLVIGGAFGGTDGAGQSTNNLAQWDGSNWWSLGNPFSATTLDMTSLNGSLYVTGNFNSFNSVSHQGLIRIGRFDGLNWKVMGAGVGGNGSALTIYGDEVLVGGSFVNVHTGFDAQGSPINYSSRFFARWAENAPNPPTFSQHPASASVTCGSAATFTVNAIGYEGRTFAWQRDGVPLNDGVVPGVGTVAGSKTTTLTITGTQAGKAGVFECVLSTACPSSVVSNPATLTMVNCCDSIDFNRDALFPDDNDLVDFLTVLAGGACSTDPTPGCSDIDFNNDGLFPDDTDLIAFLTVLAGGSC